MNPSDSRAPLRQRSLHPFRLVRPTFVQCPGSLSGWSRRRGFHLETMGIYGFYGWFVVAKLVGLITFRSLHGPVLGDNKELGWVWLSQLILGGRNRCWNWTTNQMGWWVVVGGFSSATRPHAWASPKTFNLFMAFWNIVVVMWYKIVFHYFWLCVRVYI